MNSPYALPARHFSGRAERNQTLWASFLFAPWKRFITAAIAAMARILRPLANSLGPTDLAIMENGQYDQDWKYIHMMPGRNGAGRR